MSHDDTGIKAVRDAKGYDIGFAAICRHCLGPDLHWYGELRDTYGTASIDLWQHIKKGDTA